MKPLNRRRAPRGYALILSLGMVAMLTLTSVALLGQSQRDAVVGVAVNNQALASARAVEGAERVAAQLVSSGTLPTALVGLAYCTDFASCPEERRPMLLELNRGANGDLPVAGAHYRVRGWLRDNGPSRPPTLVLHSQGFYGFDGSPNQLSSEVELELTGDFTNPNTCTGHYAGAGC